MATVYRICVKSQLESCWMPWLGSMTVKDLENDGAELVGPVEDQAGLYRLLEKIRDLNLGLVSVEWLENGAE